MPRPNTAAVRRSLIEIASADDFLHRSDMTEAGLRILDQLREIRRDCEETVKELRLLDSQLDGIAERQK